MLDVRPAAGASARPPAIAVSAVPATRGAAKPDALLAAAARLAPVLNSGRPLDAAILRRAMTAAFGGASDADGAWAWKDAYDAAETAVVLFLKTWGRGMRRQAGGGEDGPRAMLAMLERVAALEPSHTRRSEEQAALQQFSTPLPYAYAALQAAAVRPGDVVLEPSAGTGVLAVMAECALGDAAAGSLHLNEIASTRAGLLRSLFPRASVTAHNAETIADRLPNVAPTAVLMNPPFSTTPGVAGRGAGADLRHIRSAFAMLPPGGRLVAVSAANTVPGDRRWRAAFQRLDPPPRVRFSTAVDGRAYARRGTTFDTRLTVLDRDPEARPDAHFDPDAAVMDAAELLDAIRAADLSRLPAAPAADLFALAGAPALRPAPRKRRSARAAPPAPADRWGPIAELAYESSGSEGGNDDAAPGADAGPHEPWRPRAVRIPGARPHPTPLVQSAAMAAVAHPAPAYRPMLPTKVVTDGLLSDAQLESVVLAGQAHDGHLAARYRVGAGWETVLRIDRADTPAPETGDAEDAPDADATERLSAPVRFRKGWMLGDGTGCGKGRQVAAIVLDQWLRGRKRALWISQSDKLLEDARRDWTALGGRDADVFPLGKVRQGDPIPFDEGVLFTTYATLRSPARKDKPARLDQIVAWLAGGRDGALDEDARHAFQGVVVFDEAHAMANAAGAAGKRGMVAPSQQGRAGLRLQNALPDARILYVSATGASTVPGLAYAHRLGLWGAGETPFENRSKFISAMEAGGVAAMEVVARDLKALGLYQARALSYRGVEVDILKHPLTAEQRRIYDAYAGAFKIIHRNIDDALKATGVVGHTRDGDGTRTLNGAAKSAALSAFEGAKQRFFGHLLTAMKCPALFGAIDNDLANGHACVVQIVSTGEALMDRRIAEIPADEWNDVAIDLTPREYVLDYLRHAFPVQLHEPFTGEGGALMSRPVADSDGNPVLCKEAVAARDALVEKLAALPPVQSALDQLIHRFGHDAVAEITGRSRRILRLASPGGGERLALRSRPPSANLAETDDFMEGRKKILVFSMAGGTGRSYHADRSRPNTDRRVHYLLEPGWRADIAIQGLGRTHRTHQAAAPLFRPVSTDVKGERRFISTIARRLDTLGAITRGQRDGQTAMSADGGALFRASDNLESDYARAALRQTYMAIWRGNVPGWSLERFQNATGLKIVHEGILKDELPPMPQFLNRLLALPIHEQNALFAQLEKRIDALVEGAVEAGTYDRGIETIAADSLAIAGTETIHVHPSGAETELQEIVRREKLVPLAADEALAMRDALRKDKRSPKLMTNDRSKRAALVCEAPWRTLEDGAVEGRIRMIRPADRRNVSRGYIEAAYWTPTPEARWRDLWNREIDTLPSHTETRLWLVTGLLLPIWDRLPTENLRVRRLVADDGRRLIGRLATAEQAAGVRAAFGLDGGPKLAPEEIREAVLERGAAFDLANGWRLARRRIANAPRVELEGPTDADLAALKRIGCVVEMVAWRSRVFAPNADAIGRILERHPAVRADAAQGE